MKCAECGAANKPMARYCGECGAYLAQSDNDKKWSPAVSFLLALFLTSFAYQIFPIPLLSYTYFGTILNSHWICKIIVFASLWAGLLLLFYARIAYKQRTAFHRLKETLTLRESLDPNAIRLTLCQNGYRKYFSHPYYRLIKKMGNPVPSQSASPMIGNLIESENYRLDLSYTLIKFFIWVIPILGFVGTVAGIALSVNEFSGFVQNMKGFQELSQEMKAALSGVTQGLAAAFNTTYLALLFIVPLMFLSNMIQKREEELLLDIEEYCTSTLAHTGKKPARKPPYLHHG
ncbi:MAG: MotA/TolQ/ExbB proton channel family protein [Candidatus Delongbacteria bacterium]|nr:MotA/TolQ/ExbB proton channel family protein [Candidatus Delongbacteria bacterium]